MTEREEFLDIFHRYVTRPGSEKLLDWLDKPNAPPETIFVFRDRGTGSPTKKERRELDNLMEEIYLEEEEE